MEAYTVANINVRFILFEVQYMVLSHSGVSKYQLEVCIFEVQCMILSHVGVSEIRGPMQTLK